MVFKKLFGRKAEAPQPTGGHAEVPPTPAPFGFTLQVSDGGPWQPLSFSPMQTQVTIGRSSGNEVELESSEVSKRHAMIENRDGVLVLRDLGGTSPCLVNGSPIREVALRNGDTIQISGFTLALQIHGEPASEPAPVIAGPVARDAVLAELDRRLGGQGKIVNDDDDLQLRTQSMGHPIKITISDSNSASICVKAQNTRGLIMLILDPDAVERAVDPADPWDSESEASERSFVGKGVYVQQMMDVAQERANFESLPDWQQWVRLFEAHELAALVASFDELQIQYMKCLEDLASPADHLFSTVQMAIRSAEFLSSGRTPIIEELGGIYINGQKVDSALTLGASSMATCHYCHAATPLQYLRCNNCGAPLSVPGS